MFAYNFLIEKCTRAKWKQQSEVVRVGSTMNCDAYCDLTSNLLTELISEFSYNLPYHIEETNKKLSSLIDVDE